MAQTEIASTMGSIQNSPVRAFSLQKYLLLHSQHEALQKEIDSFLNSKDAAFPSTKRDESPWKSSPKTTLNARDDSKFSKFAERRNSEALFDPHEDLSNISRRLSTPITTSATSEIATTQSKLQQVNLQIKKTLMELLNCEDVKGDTRYRGWVQSRLMNVERELRESRSMRGWRMEGELYNRRKSKDDNVLE